MSPGVLYRRQFPQKGRAGQAGAFERTDERVKGVLPMADNKQHDTRTPPRLRDGNPHGQFRPCRVRLFQERHHDHRRRQNGAGTGSGSRCYTGADLSGVSRGMEKAAMPGSVAAEM